MTMQWLMTVQENGVPSLHPPNAKIPSGVQFDITPRRIAVGSDGGHEPPPNPNCFRKLWALPPQQRPAVIEVRRPDGTCVSAGLHSVSMHLNFSYEYRYERDAAGRIPNPWMQSVILAGLRVEDVPVGSEIWGDVADADLSTAEESPDDPLG